MKKQKHKLNALQIKTFKIPLEATKKATIQGMGHAAQRFSRTFVEDCSMCICL